jgi:hypothetical protein
LGNGSLTSSSVPVLVGAVPGDGFVPVTDTRVLDTRVAPLSIVNAGVTIDVQVAGGSSPVPASASAVVVNVAAVAPLAPGHIRVFPTGTVLPTASVLNFAAGRNTPNQVIVKVGAGGKVSLYAGNTTHMIVDVSGYFTGTGDKYTVVASPATIGTLTVPAFSGLGTGTSDIAVAGVGGIPVSGVSKVVLNVAVLGPTSTGHIRVYPTGGAIPPTSTNNFAVGDSRTNLVVVAPSAGGQVRVYNTTTQPVTVRVDTVGYFSSTGSGFVAVDPIRPLDTRNVDPVTGLNTIVSGGDFREVQIRGFGPVPNLSSVKAVVVNVAAVAPTLAGTFSGGPSGVVSPLESLIHPPAQNVANLMVLPIGADGKIRITNNMLPAGTTHMIVDITGYFTG